MRNQFFPNAVHNGFPNAAPNRVSPCCTVLHFRLGETEEGGRKEGVVSVWRAENLP